MNRERKTRGLRLALGEETLRKGDELAFFCPRHRANSTRRLGQLSVNLVTEKFHCWSCDWGGFSLSPLLKLAGSNEYVSEYEETRSRGKNVPLPEPEYDQPTLPSEFKSLSHRGRDPYALEALRYLDSRGVGSEMILRMKLGFCSEGKYRHRVIFPSFDAHGFLNFSVGRTYRPGGLRYLHEHISKDIIFNDYLIDWNMPVVLTEGVFDAMMVGDNSIPIQGSRLEPGTLLFTRIVERKVPVYVFLDSDARSKQLRLVTSLMRHGVECFSGDVRPWKDVGEMPREAFLRAKDNARPIDDRIDILRARVMG